MSNDTDKYDFFVSYARADNNSGWITGFLDELEARHEEFFPGRKLEKFFDTEAIGAGKDWAHTLYHGVAQSRLFLAFVSPRYLASEWCQREWRAWMDTEIAKHILTDYAEYLFMWSNCVLCNDNRGSQISNSA